MSLAETELTYRQDNNFTVTISLPAHVLPIRINTAKSSTQYDHHIRNSDAAAAALPAQQSTSPTSRSQNVTHHSQSPNSRRKKECFYVVTSGRRTGVFDNW